MLQTAARTSVSAIDLLKEDHRRVQELFEQFEEVDSQLKSEIAQEAVRELEIHSRLEEQIFYPRVRHAIELDHVMLEAEQAHHVVDLIIEELKLMPFGRKFIAKFTVLMKNVREHIKEEEEVMFPELERSDVDLYELGGELQMLKSALMIRRGNGFVKAALWIALGLGVAKLGRSFLQEA